MTATTTTAERDAEKKNITGQQEAATAVGNIENKLLDLAKISLAAEKRNWQNVKLVRTIDKTHDGTVTCLKVLDENRIISAAGSGDSTIKIWDRESWRCLQTLTGHTNTVNGLKRLGHSKLISASGDRTIKI
jgi:WD40 repeat protein